MTFVSQKKYCKIGNFELNFDLGLSCLLKHFIRKIKIKVNRRFDVSNIILKIEVVYANVKVVMTVEDFEYLICAFRSA